MPGLPYRRGSRHKDGGSNVLARAVLVPAVSCRAAGVTQGEAPAVVKPALRGQFPEKPSAGLEPATPSLPSRREGEPWRAVTG